MDSKKHHAVPVSEQILSTRGKVVSGWFSFGVGSTLIVLAVLLLSNSLKAPLFQGFNSGSGNSNVVSWPSSFSTTSSCFASDCTNGTIEGKSNEANVSRVDNEKTHLGNFTENVENGNGSLSVEEGRVQQKTHEINGSVFTKNGNLSQVVNNESLFGEGNVKAKVTENVENGNGSLSVEEGRVQQKTHEANGSVVTKNGNLSQVVSNESLFGEGNVKAKDAIEVKSYGNGNVTENNNVGNLSINGEVGRSPGGEERAIEANNGGDLAEKNKTIISSYDSKHMKKMHEGSFENCDIFDGRWVRDNSKPYYPAGSCPYIDRDFDCNLNGRPDNGFVKWKWQPNGCDIPRLNATDFLERLRGKKLVFVGDSLNRNMWESLVCILRHSVRKKKRVYEISGRREFKKKGFYAFRFEDYNCTVDFVAAPFLVRESTFNGRNGSFETLRLDLMDQTTSMYQDADVIVFNTGHWWTHEKTSKGEDYYQEGNYVYPRLKVLDAYKRALTTWARWIDKNIVSNQTQVFFRGYSVTHFKGGQWNSGGKCHKETEPIFNETYLAKYPSKMRALEYVLKEIKTPVTYLNISRLTDFRKDGHPSIYRMKYKTHEEKIAAERSQDCSHWCLPGVPDTWNELLYASLLKAGRGSWGN